MDLAREARINLEFRISELGFGIGGGISDLGLRVVSGSTVSSPPNGSAELTVEALSRTISDCEF